MKTSFKSLTGIGLCLAAAMLLSGCGQSQEDKDGQALVSAARADDAATVNKLLAQGVDVDYAWKDKLGSTALQTASVHGNLDVAKILIAHHADVNKPNDKGAAPLFMAAYQGNLDVVKLLIASHANVAAKVAGDGPTPLDGAATTGYPAIVQ